MNTPGDAIASAIRSATRMVLSFSEDLKGSDWDHRPCAGANCAAWTVGHLILSARSMIGRASPETALPTIPDGFVDRYARNDTAPKLDTYPDADRLRGLLESHYLLMADVAAKLPAARLSTPMEKPHPMFSTIGELLGFAALHMTMHAGQISTIRRSLGRPPIV